MLAVARHFSCLLVQKKPPGSPFSAYPNCTTTLFTARPAGGVNFTGTATTIEGAGLKEIAEETVKRHKDAFGNSPVLEDVLDIGGDYAVRLRGEAHVWRSETVAALQHAVRGNARDRYREFSRLVNEVEDLFDFGPLEFTRDVAASKALNTRIGPKIIIAASGMAEAGRILHHLKHHIEEPRSTTALPDFRHSAPASAVTFGRLS